jgi:hypothetical protein
VLRTPTFTACRFGRRGDVLFLPETSFQAIRLPRPASNPI